MRSPGSAFPIQNRGYQAHQGVTRWQLDLRGMRSGLCANPFPIRIVQINYCALSSAAGSCRSACRAARLAFFSAACSCRNFVSCRWEKHVATSRDAKKPGCKAPAQTGRMHGNARRAGICFLWLRLRHKPRHNPSVSDLSCIAQASQ